MNTFAGKKKQEYIESIRPAMVFDYFNEGVSSVDIGVRYGVSANTVIRSKDRVPFGRSKEILRGEEKTILLVDTMDMDKLIEVMEEFKIGYRMPSKNHEFIEKYESKI